MKRSSKHCQLVPTKQNFLVHSSLCASLNLQLALRLKVPKILVHFYCWKQNSIWHYLQSLWYVII